jgi:hypothetical protein
MKITMIAVSIAFLGSVVASSFASSAYAGFSRSAQMSGRDATYGSTGKCSGGACTLKKPKAPKAPKKM